MAHAEAIAAPSGDVGSPRRIIGHCPGATPGDREEIRMKERFLFLVGLTLILLFQTANAQEAQPVVQRIDHVMTETANIRGVDRMQSLFADTLGLPVWFVPGLHRDVNRPTWDFYNTGVYVGGVFLEFITFDPEEVIAEPEPRARFSGFAFERGVANIADLLDQRGIARSRESSFAIENSSGGLDTLFTNIFVRDLSQSATAIFFCHYHPTFFDTPGFHFPSLPPIQTNAEHHAHFMTLLEESEGGILGIRRASEVVISVPVLEEGRAAFGKLLKPLIEIEPGLWELPHGPSVRLVTGDDYEVERLVLTVRSLKTSIDALKRLDLLGEEGPDRAILDPDRLWGLQIQLVEEGGIEDGLADAR
jgi:hypothetical protein